ncbi:PAP2 superfamily protein [Actinomadura rubteroloni]|uniref:PAP2 superfamily protein n=1 Tax=Actinomadura rubteroloni TaxID=1926885 RepID=A0A2P4UQ24_9ACTN|nr:phosphatase PAP2 family protein [Actinomadura rubteroloni]POM27129.1 PAP2 superfamily protein [Actinomadura rubteroloni]
MSLFIAALLPLGLLLILAAGTAFYARAGRPAADRGVPLLARTLGGLNAPLRFTIVAGAGLAVAYGISAALGPVAMACQPFDDSAYKFIVEHHLHAWVSFNRVITDVSGSWLVRGTCVGAALMLTLVWRRHRWLPAVAMGTMLFASHYLVLGLTYLMDRPAPPHSGGTYPSGGNVRVVAVYGLVAFFFLAAARTGRRGRVVAWTILALLAYVEAYSRSYLAVHWVTDVIAGLVFGSLLLTALTLASDAALAGEDPVGESASGTGSPAAGRRRLPA